MKLFLFKNGIEHKRVVVSKLKFIVYISFSIAFTDSCSKGVTLM